MTPSFHVVVAGAGLAAIEAVLGLRELAGDRVAITVVGPRAELLHQPLTDMPWAIPAQEGSGERPLRGFGGVRRHPFDAVVGRLGAELLRDEAVGADVAGRRVRTRGGRAVEYDALLIAVGAVRGAALDGGVAFGGPRDVPAVQELLAGLGGPTGEAASGRPASHGPGGRLAVVIPPGAPWTLPAYEVALRGAAAGAEVSVVTAEPRPADAFGPAAPAVAEQLDAAGVRVVQGVVEDVEDGMLDLVGDARLSFDALVALPYVHGPWLDGRPADSEGFIPTDAHGAVDAAEGVFAAGDATTFPIRQGGLACQQAATAAQSIAHRFDPSVSPDPLRPVLRGALPLPGGGALYLEHDLAGGEARSSLEPLWSPAHRVAGVRLPAFLEDLERA